MAVFVLVQINGVAGADVHAGVGNAALAAVRNTDLLGGAGIAGVGNDVDQRLIEILLIRGSLLNLGADGGGRAVGVQIHAQSQLDPCGDNGALQKYIVTVVSHLTGNQLIGDHIHLIVVLPAVGQTGYLREYVVADIVYRAVYTSHIFSSHVR